MQHCIFHGLREQALHCRKTVVGKPSHFNGCDVKQRPQGKSPTNNDRYVQHIRLVSISKIGKKEISQLATKEDTHQYRRFGRDGSVSGWRNSTSTTSIDVHEAAETSKPVSTPARRPKYHGQSVTPSASIFDLREVRCSSTSDYHLV